MTVFLVTFILSNLLFSSLIGAVLLTLDRQKRFQSGELLLYSLGLGPVFTSLTLYYLFALFPRQSDLFYITIILIVYLFLGFIGRRALINGMRRLFDRNTEFPIVSQAVKPWPHYLAILRRAALVLIGLIIFGFFVRYVQAVQLNDHDLLGYGVMGKILYSAKALDPIWINNYAANGFLHEAKHPPAVSLLLTWEKMVAGLFSADTDIYFRSVNGAYAFLILGVVYFVLAKESRLLAWLAIGTLLSSLVFFFCLFTYHLDSCRIFLLILSWIFLAYSVQRGDRFSVVLFGVTSGLATFIHALNMAVVAINLVVFVLFLNARLVQRIAKTALAGGLILLFGALHYLLELLIGRGWIW